MATCISLLRGINVGGKNLIRMNALHKMYEHLGCEHVVTYLQSGNVVFNYNDEGVSQLEQIIPNQIKNEFGLDVLVVMLTLDLLKQVVDDNPFDNDPTRNQTNGYVTFLSKRPNNYDLQAIMAKKQPDESLSVKGQSTSFSTGLSGDAQIHVDELKAIWKRRGFHPILKRGQFRWE